VRPLASLRARRAPATPPEMHSSRCAGALSLRRAHSIVASAHCFARAVPSHGRHGTRSTARAHLALPLCARFSLDAKCGLTSATSAAATSRHWLSTTAAPAPPLPTSSSSPASASGAGAPAPPSAFKIVNQLSKLRLSVMNGIAASGMFAMLLPFDIVNNSGFAVHRLLSCVVHDEPRQLMFLLYLFCILSVQPSLLAPF
jgi:hypothetical protein